MNLYDQLDNIKRWQGEFLDAVGLGPEETPSRTLLSGPVFTLKTYGSEKRAGPAVLIVPAPIKKSYIWDLTPETSVVMECLNHSVRPSMIQWEKPGPDDQELGLAAYSDSFMLSCMDALRDEFGQSKVFLAGHSLGGTFSSIFSSLYPDRVQGLVLLGAPIHFGPGMGDLDTLIAHAPKAQVFTEQLGNVPGSFLSAMSNMASPESYRDERWADWFRSLTDLETLQTHMRVERWTLDEMPMPRRLFEDIVELLYRDDSFMKGILEIDGREARPSNVKSPILTVADERSHVVTPRSSLAFSDAAASRNKQVLWYKGDVGVALQHVGMLVGKNAHRNLWPSILKWIHAHYKPKQSLKL